MSQKLGIVVSVVCLMGMVGCASEQIEPLPALPEVPDYVQVPHPTGYDLADLNSIFISPLAPKRETLANCEANFYKLRTLTTSPEEIAAGAREMITAHPKEYHWCFYNVLIGVNETLKNDVLWNEKQAKILDDYLFLVPVARAFKSEFNDPRYLRWAIKQYRAASEWVFFRRMELSPQATQEMVEDVSNPFALWRKPEATGSVIEKYGLSKETPVGPAPGVTGPLQAKPLEAKVSDAKDSTRSPASSAKPTELTKPDQPADTAPAF
jgi:hypothetical protein